MHQEEKAGTVVEHHEDVQTSSVTSKERQEPELIGLVANVDELPQANPPRLGQTELGLMAAVAQFGYIAPILSLINADLGPDPNYIWISLIYNARPYPFESQADTLSMIGGAILGVVGTIICATSQSINVLIGGNVICGVANATQMSFHVVMGELVPLRYRYKINAILYSMSALDLASPFSLIAIVSCIPASALGGIIAYSFVVHYPTVSWRGPYYLLIAINALALICWVLFYYPPNFRNLHVDQGDKSKKAFWIKHYDYVGTVLFAAGFVMFTIGLNSGVLLDSWTMKANIDFNRRRERLSLGLW
ncbi:hypothetical protein LTR10_012481 [Elasticomyces elasticus]|nr:hypothetical protein LTR10_012481 [Elasticomyces elasticus]KAK4965955.1 hypothetical protein LTR42_011969 [Elasticomyces elasticus]KAK5716131.1 hypothetical protein LTR15_009957 [Elasticomyces elasticus]